MFVIADAGKAGLWQCLWESLPELTADEFDALLEQSSSLHQQQQEATRTKRPAACVQAADARASQPLQRQKRLCTHPDSPAPAPAPAAPPLQPPALTKAAPRLLRVHSHKKSGRAPRTCCNSLLLLLHRARLALRHPRNRKRGQPSLLRWPCASRKS
eukprot:TRINITY_DN41_c1_g1_i9.p2 TRINITY_DN41_c1_g1~~TRINITY_DN41_c1_g1_i9.p2  ORF type:complete len:157 (+),score=31.40 TRINITY_DN41_c1_g1_i9:187-657(+)